MAENENISGPATPHDMVSLLTTVGVLSLYWQV